MKLAKRILLSVACAALLAASWAAAITAKSSGQKQLELMESASEYIADEVYVLAVPLLEEAAAYQTDRTLDAEEMLKMAYLHLLDQRGYTRKYISLLEKQMAQENASPALFAEAAEFYLSRSKVQDALAVLRDGIEKTQHDESLVELYEANRYQYVMGTTYYQDVTMTCAGAIQVKQNNLWGLAAANGSLQIPCEYDQISTYSNDRVITCKDGVISAVNADNNRVALFHGAAEKFGNYADDRFGYQAENAWRLATGTFHTGSVDFDEIGMYSNGYAPAKSGGKWGMVDTSGIEWLIPAEYESAVQDLLGRAYAQNAVFMSRGGQVLLLVDGEETGNVYEDARPFSDGWAAVKRDGKWGFIDIQGNVMIDFQFDDALSFGQHLAAVKEDGLWGYVSLRGELVIQPQFLNARSFYGGSAPVETVDGWRFITLLEYRGGSDLL